MKVLIVHTRYRQRGGEDAMVDAQVALLRDEGATVVEVGFDNATFAEAGALATAARTVWHRAAAARVREAVARERPDVVHVHNTFPGASPAVFRAAAGAPVVHTLHNYRWTCVAATLRRAGRPCEDCVGTHPWRGAWHGCYDGRRAASAVVAGTLALHRARRTFDAVDRFVAPSRFVAQTLGRGAVPSERMRVVANFVPDRGPPAAPPGDGAPALFVGRLSEEKGVRLLAEAWRRGDLPPLEVVGDGPDAAVFEGVPGVTLLGALSPEAVRARFDAARLVVVPSVWHEPFGLVVAEAFAAGRPVVATRMGALPELVDEGRTGWLTAPEPEPLADAVRAAWAEAPARAEDARATFEARFTGAVHAAAIRGVYREAAERAAARAADATGSDAA